MSLHGKQCADELSSETARPRPTHPQISFFDVEPGSQLEDATTRGGKANKKVTGQLG